MPDKPRESVIGMSQAKLEHFEKAIKAKLDGFSSSDFDLCHDPRCLDIGKHYAKPETDYMLVSWDSALEAAERAITDLPSPTWERGTQGGADAIRALKGKEV